MSINLQEKGQVYMAGRDWQIHLFLPRLCFKCHPRMNLVLKHTLEFDEMSLLLSPDQIKWMKVKQEHKYYFCHFFMHYRNWVSWGDFFFFRQIPTPAQCHPLICQPADGESFQARKGMPPENKDQGNAYAAPASSIFNAPSRPMADMILCAGQAWLKNKVGFSARRNNHF